MNDTDFQKLYDKADKAGRDAVEVMMCRPMTVCDNAGNSWYVADGVCGFAWVNVKPGTSKFARWLKSKNYASTDSYYGGVTIWISSYNQSMQKKETYARAFAKVLSDEGIKAYAASRID